MDQSTLNSVFCQYHYKMQYFHYQFHLLSHLTQFMCHTVMPPLILSYIKMSSTQWECRFQIWEKDSIGICNRCSLSADNLRWRFGIGYWNAGRTHLDLTCAARASAVWKACYCLCAKIFPGTTQEADGDAVCITESMWLSISSSGKELTEGFNRAKPSVRGEVVIQNRWK